MKFAKLCHVGVLVLICFSLSSHLRPFIVAQAQDAVGHEIFLPMIVDDGHVEPPPSVDITPTATATTVATVTPNPITTPTVSTTPTTTPTATATPTATVMPSPTSALPADPGCALLALEAELSALMRENPEQQRPSLTCSPILAAVARDKAREMAERDYFGHVNPDGYGPNYLVRMAGYPLPAFYDPRDTGNNIESIGAGQPNPGAVWAAWMGSGYHRLHLLGENLFYAEQGEYGIGYHYDSTSRYRHYWVVITARQAE